MSSPNSTHRFTNRLARETSPYLLQHAHNPVDWFPWGPEAFAEARKRDVPIFLSVGYSTCYWCHVMERESFENEQVAALMNSHFVCVKLDREERPDVDDLYMTATQAMTQSGGWPMNVFLEPQSLRPFWCGTYFPPQPGHGRPAFSQVLSGIADAWRKQRTEVLEQARELGEAVIERLAAKHTPTRVSERQVAQAIGQLLKMHDVANGGFGDAPKFPQPVYLDFLLRFRPHAGDEDTAAAVDGAIRFTLDKMALGGIHDHVDGGFHRYSVDRFWTVPHFEKMLYDNAQLAEVYAKAAHMYDDSFYRRVVDRTLSYVLREMTSPNGAFFSAQDAEVNHREGQNYLWNRDQLNAALPPEDAAFAARVFNVDAGPNFRDPHHPDEPASNVLTLSDRPETLAPSFKADPASFEQRLDRVCATLEIARRKRDQPIRDDKVLAGWNGLMIAGMALGGSALKKPEYIRAAQRAADFVLTSMRDASSGLFRTFKHAPSVEHPARIPAFLEDYAFLIHGLLELHRALQPATSPYLAHAVELAREVESRFSDHEDPSSGAYFDTLAGQTDLFARSRSEYDGALPSGSGVMLNNLLDLFEFTQDQAYLKRAGACLRSVSAFVAASPVGAVNSTRGLLRLLTDHPGALRDAMTGLDSPAPLTENGAQPQPVSIFAAVDRVTVSPTRAGGLVIQVRIDDGYHVNAADPGGPDLIGFRVRVVNGSGVSVYADYPAGESWTPSWVEDAQPIRVYKGTLEIPVVVERQGEWKGQPLIAVTYQACNDTACLSPATLELDVALDPIAD